MRSYDSSDKYDSDEAKRLRAEPWMLDLLALNPEYTCWGPHEDYMSDRGSQWGSPVFHTGWKDFGPWGLDDLNELVNFYFQVTRESKECPECGGSGYHPDAQWVTESFYGHSTPFRPQNAREVAASAVMASFGGGAPTRQVDGFPSESVLARYKPEFRAFCEAMAHGDGSWHDKITQDEADALVAEDRLRDLTHEFVKGEGWKKKDAPVNAQQVNDLQNRRGMGLVSHDAINRGILIRTRCERMGIPVTCPKCEGHGHVFTDECASVNLVLWFLHPRKGCSRGVEIKGITQTDLPDVHAYLRQAAKRNSDRFGKIPS